MRILNDEHLNIFESISAKQMRINTLKHIYEIYKDEFDKVFAEIENRSKSGYFNLTYTFSIQVDTKMIKKFFHDIGYYVKFEYSTMNLYW